MPGPSREIFGKTQRTHRCLTASYVTGLVIKWASTPHRRSVYLRRIDNGRISRWVSLSRKSTFGFALTLIFDLWPWKHEPGVHRPSPTFRDPQLLIVFCSTCTMSSFVVNKKNVAFGYLTSWWVSCLNSLNTWRNILIYCLVKQRVYQSRIQEVEELFDNWHDLQQSS